MKYLIGILGIIGLMTFWAIIQYFWKVVFIDQHTDDDVLAGRSSCGNCGCGTTCKNKKRVK